MEYPLTNVLCIGLYVISLSKKVVMGEQKLVGGDIINQLIHLINPNDDSLYECLMWTKNRQNVRLLHRGNCISLVQYEYSRHISFTSFAPLSELCCTV